MGAQGSDVIDFGANGASDATLVITGQAAILGTSLAEAWIIPADSADHLADEHLVEPIQVYAMSIVAGTGFTIRAIYRGLGDTMAFGRWNVGWVWN